MEHTAPTVDSALFVKLFRKRSFLTPAHAHPCAEQEEIDKAAIGNLSDSGGDRAADLAESLAADIAAKYFGRPEAEQEQTSPARCGNDTKGAPQLDLPTRTSGNSGSEKAICALLSDQPLSVDKLCELTGLQPHELSVSLLILELSEQIKREPGNYYVRCKPEPPHNTADLFQRKNDRKDKMVVVVTTVVGFIIEHCHGISRRYLQNYLAAYWCYKDRTTWCPGSLLELCRQSPTITYTEILGYVSPPMVKVLPAFDS